MSELRYPLLEKNQKETDLYCDVNYYKQAYTSEITTTTKTAYDFDWYIVRPALGLDVTYGINSTTQIRVGGSYTMDSRYRFSYVDNKSAWREDIVNINSPFSFNSELEMRPTPLVDIIAGYRGELYELSARQRYGAAANRITDDLTANGITHSQGADLTLIMLSSGNEYRHYVKSDIDGMLRPLLEKGQLRLTSKYSFEEEEKSYRDHKDSNGEFSQEKFNRNSFYNELGAGITNTCELGAYINYYLPYTYVLKENLVTIHNFLDTAFKYEDTYDLGLNLKKRYSDNVEYLVAGHFFTRTEASSSNRYNAGDGRTASIAYPYPGKIRDNNYSFKVGQTYVSDAKKERAEDAVTFDRINHPLLEKNQFMVGAFLDYHVRLYRSRWDSPTAPRHFSWEYQEYLISGNFSYGVTDKLELSANAAYEFPYKYKYAYLSNINNDSTVNYADTILERIYLNLSTILRFDLLTDLKICAGFAPVALMDYQYETPNRNIISNYSIGTNDFNTTAQRSYKFSNFYANVKFRKLF